MTAEPQLGSGRRRRRGMPPGGGEVPPPEDGQPTDDSARPITAAAVRAPAQAVPGGADAQETLAGEPVPAFAKEQPSELSGAPERGAEPARPRSNPYAGARRVAMNHRVLEPIAARVAGLADELRAAGYPASQAELLQAFIHFRLPERQDAARLIERWRAFLNTAPRGGV